MYKTSDVNTYKITSMRNITTKIVDGVTLLDPNTFRVLYDNILNEVGIVIITSIILLIIYTLKRYFFVSIANETNDTNKFTSFIKSLPQLYSIHGEVLKSKKIYLKHYDDRYKFLKSTIEKSRNSIVLYVVDDEDYIDIKDHYVVEVVKEFEECKKKLLIHIIKRYSEQDEISKSVVNDIETKKHINKIFSQFRNKFWSGYKKKVPEFKKCDKCNVELIDWAYFYFLGRFEVLLGFFDFIYTTPILPEERLIYISDFFREDYVENINVVKREIIQFHFFIKREELNQNDNADVRD